MAKALARAGVASRREVERLIAAGRVALNGKVLDTPAIKIAPGDILTVDGAVVGDAEPTRVWRYHKPAGLVTTHKDPKGRPTVFEQLPAGLPRVISIGRLDLNSEGLLLLTNDGALARALELPATGLVRRYRARARGQTSQAKLDRLKAGMTVEGVHYGPIEASLDKVRESDDGEGRVGANLWITVTLAEGKNREVRKVLEAIGLTVNRLIRLSYGPFQLGALAPGEVEEIGPRVIRDQLARHIDAASLPKGDRVTAPPARAETGERPSRRGPGSALRAAAGRGQPREDEPKKTEYKPGWAKPKKRVGHAKPAQAKLAPAASAETKPAHAKPARTKPDRARPARRAAKSGPAHAAEAKPAHAKPARAKPDRAKPDRIRPARPAAKPAARRPGRPKAGGPKPRS